VNQSQSMVLSSYLNAGLRNGELYSGTFRVSKKVDSEL
jgi:hypothetical protein